MYQRTHAKQRAFEFSLCHEILSDSPKCRLMIEEEEIWMGIHPSPLRGVRLGRMVESSSVTHSQAPSPGSSPQSKRRRQVVRFTPELEHELLGRHTREIRLEKSRGGKPMHGLTWLRRCQQILMIEAAAHSATSCLMRSMQLRRTAGGELGSSRTTTSGSILLAELSEMRGIETVRLNEKNQESDERPRDDEPAVTLRDAAVHGITTQAKSSTKTRLQQLLQYLERRDTRLQAIEQRLIASEKKRIELEQRRMRLQERRLGIERQERLAFYELIKAAVSSGSSTPPRTDS